MTQPQSQPHPFEHAEHAQAVEGDREQSASEHREADATAGDEGIDDPHADDVDITPKITPGITPKITHAPHVPEEAIRNDVNDKTR